MKLLLDERNPGVETNNNDACSITESNCGNLSCNCFGINCENCSIKLFNEKMNLRNKIINLLVVIIFIMTTTGFTYSNNVQKVPDYIEEDILKGNIKLEDKTNVNLKSKISQEEYEKTIKEVENFLLENHVIFNNTSREEFSIECDKFIKNKKEHTIIDTLVDLKLIISSLKQGHLGLESNYFTEILPIKLSEFSDGVYITTSYKNDIDILGSKLLGINDISITEVESKLFKYAYGENKNFRHISSIGNLVILDMLKRENIVKGQKIKLKLKKNGKIFYKNINIYKIEDWQYGKIDSDYSGMYFVDVKKCTTRLTRFIICLLYTSPSPRDS